MHDALARMASLSEGADTPLLGGNIFDQEDLSMQLSHNALMPLGVHRTVLNAKRCIRLQDL